MYMYRIFLLFSYLFLSVSAFSANKPTLEQAREKCEKARSLSQHSKLEAYSQEYLDMAKAQKNNRALTYAYFYNGLAKLFLGHTEESQIMLNNAEELLAKEKNDSVKALIMNAKAITQALVKNNNFVAQQFFFKSIEAAKEAKYEDLIYRVRGNLLTLSHSMDNEVALDNAKEVYNYGISHNNNEQISMGAYYLATYYNTHKMYDETEKYIKVALNTYKKHPYEDIASVYALYAKMLQNKGDTHQAELQAKNALNYARKYHQPSMEVETCITYAEVLTQEKRCHEAIEMIQSAMRIAEKIGMTNKIADCNQILAENYLTMGNNKEAIKCLQVANQQLANQSTINMERIAHEQQVMHEIEQKEMEEKVKAEQISAQRRVMMLLAMVVVILVILLIYIFITYRHRQILYKQIVKQNARAISHQRNLQEQIELLIKDKESDASTGDNTGKTEEKESLPMGDKKVDILYNRLCLLMEHDRLFCEAQLTRERLAERLNTNRTYLTAIIKEKTGMNYIQFINNYRINEAIRILSDKDKISYPLKQIWSDLGFSSPSTFYKLFQQAVGITPSVYRKQFLEVNSEEINDLTDEDTL